MANYYYYPIKALKYIYNTSQQKKKSNRVINLPDALFAGYFNDKRQLENKIYV